MTIHQYIYVNKPKIDNLYAQLVDRVEEEYRTQHSTEIAGKGDIKTGTIPKLLAVALEGELAGKKENSTEAISKLTIEKKLEIIQEALQNFNECTNFNKNQNIFDKVGKFISVKTQFTMPNTPKNVVSDINKSETFEMEGSFFNVNFNINVGSYAFISPTMAFRLVNVTSSGGKVPLRVFGTLINLDNVKKIGFIDPIAIHYA